MLEALTSMILLLTKVSHGLFLPDLSAPTIERSPGTHRSGAAGQWRERFIRMPWFREELTSRGSIADTFETTITWEHFPHLYTSVKEATEQAVKEATGQQGWVSCRLTHIYPDGQQSTSPLVAWATNRR